MPKAGIAVDDWKLPVFRRRLTDAGYTYEDRGAPTPNVTMLMVPFTDQAALQEVVVAAQAECAAAGKPGGQRP